MRNYEIFRNKKKFNSAFNYNIQKAIEVKGMSEKIKSKEEQITKTSVEKFIENAVLIGSKPIITYIIATLTQFNKGNEKIVLKARGRAISRAVSVAEILEKKILPGQVKVGNISISTERVGEGEQARDVSTIEIVLERAK